MFGKLGGTPLAWGIYCVRGGKRTEFDLEGVLGTVLLLGPLLLFVLLLLSTVLYDLVLLYSCISLGLE